MSVIRTFIEAAALTLGASGYYVIFTQLWRIWHYGGEQISLAARQRRTAVRSQAYKDKYGTGLVVAAVVLYLAATAILLSLAPIVACAAIPQNGFLKVVGASGIFLLVYQAIYWFTQRYL